KLTAVYVADSTLEFCYSDGKVILGKREISNLDIGKCSGRHNSVVDKLENTCTKCTKTFCSSCSTSIALRCSVCKLVLCSKCISEKSYECDCGAGPLQKKEGMFFPVEK